jgi:hypothetical protein
LAVAGAAEITAIATFEVIEPEVATANESHSDLWLTGAVRVIFMSYYIPLPGLDNEGLGKTWDGLDVVSKIVTENGNFHIAAPMEFRFVKGGDSAMSGTFTEDPEHTWFVNLDLISFVEADQMEPDYPAELLQFFADVERKWVEMGGFPHNSKMYGFYDPTGAPGTYSKTGPFNPNFLTKLRKLRGARLDAFNAYRKSLDPNGLIPAMNTAFQVEPIKSNSHYKVIFDTVQEAEPFPNDKVPELHKDTSTEILAELYQPAVWP